jgi:hypothetical protein
MDEIIWMSVADGSWGGCDKDDLIMVESSEFTPEEWDDLNEAASDNDAFRVINAVHERTKRTRI